MRRALTPSGRARLGPLALSALVGTAAIVVAEMRLSAESVNMTTYFSSPRGWFEELRVAGNATLANNAAAQVLVDPLPLVGGAEKMIVDGNVRANRFLGTRTLPPGMIAIFRGGCPAGWAPVGAFNGRTIVNSGAYGGTFDAVPDHTHVVPHTHTTDDPPPAISSFGDINPPSNWHNHTVSYDHAHAIPGGYGTNGASSFVNPGMDGGSDDAYWGNHGHTGGAGGTGGASTGGTGTVIEPAGHDHTYDFPPVPGGYGGAPPLDVASSQFPFVNVTFCSSP